MSDPRDRIYREPFTGAYTLFPDNAASVDVSSADATFAQARTIYVGGAGNITVRPLAASSDVTFAMQSGCPVPVRVIAVRTAGATATNLVSVW